MSPDTERVPPAHVMDRHGFVWRVVRDGGMATRADYTGITSIGIKELRAICGPLTDLEAALGAQAGPPPLDVERLARAIRSRYGLKESEAEVAIFLRAIVGTARLGVAPESSEDQ